MDSNEILNLVGSIGILVTAIGAVIVNIIVAMKTGKKVDDNVKAIAGVSAQVQEVHTITNSNLSAVKAELKQATMQIEEMKTFVRSLTSERDKLAAITAVAAVGHSPIHVAQPSQVVVEAPTETLKEIAQNTENIDKNTKKTEMDVKQLTKESKEKK